VFSVSTPAATTALTTLANVKAELSITGTDEDAYLTAKIARVSAQICTYLKVPTAGDGTRTLGRETLVETIRRDRPLGYDPGWTGTYLDRFGPADSGRTRLLLSRRPIVLVTSVVEDGTTLDASAYEVDGAAGILTRLSSDMLAAWAARKVVVTYVAGWKLPGDTGPTMPGDIEDAAIRLIKTGRFARERDPGIKSETIPGPITTVYQDATSELPEDVTALLDPYRYV
jgi:hypothetical protein